MQSVLKSVVKTGSVPSYGFSNQISIRALQNIKNSIPLLESKGLEISNSFYQKEIFPKNISLFSQNKETQERQASTLAQFLVTIARRAENLEKMNTHFDRVSQKHAGFGIQPEHYPVFTGGILAALKANGATPDQVSAWDDLLSVVAKALQANEAKSYSKHENRVGGWNGTRAFSIKEKQDLGNGFFSYYIHPTDGQKIQSHVGGQYVTIKAVLPGYGEQYRHVPICNTPNKHQYYRLTASVETDIGAFLATQKEGSTLDVLPPQGRFTLQGHFNDVVLIGTGHSNMQLIQIANAAQDRNVYYIDVVNNKNKDTLKPIFEKYQALNPNWKTIQVNVDAGDVLDYETVTNFAPVKNADYYFCSPNPEFARNVNDVLTTVGVDHKNKYYEFEGPYEFLA